MVLNNFYSIDNAIDLYYSDFGKLPADLDALKEESNYLSDKDLEDPETEKRFDYEILSEKQYQLCALFRTSNKDDEEFKRGFYDEFRLHDAGYQCLKQRVRDENAKEVPLRVR